MADAADGLREKVEEALNRIRPAIQSDGGDVELVDVTDTTVRILLVGSCSGCPSSTATLARGIEQVIREAVPEIKWVESV